MADSLEEILHQDAKEAPSPKASKAGGSFFDDIGNSIGDLVNAAKSIPSLVKDTIYYTYYTVKPALGLAVGCLMTGGLNALIFPFGMALGAIGGDIKNKEKVTFRERFKKISNELAVGGVLSGLLHYLFIGNTILGNVVKQSYGTAASLAARGAYSLAQLSVFLGAHEYLNRALISGYKPQPLKDMGKKIKKMWPIIPPIMANFTVVPEYLSHTYQMPVAAGISLLYGLLKAEKKKDEKAQSPQAAPAPYGLPPGYMPQAA